ncbi:MAG TPA: TetR/AcrR family transcriptional regulator C-terminal domain-containing protein [Pilimelia sp.]|nr:TetR/AcrR family transcriptional regulator C-terminal domain-containing protein [Pilimelia sp.]
MADGVPVADRTLALLWRQRDAPVPARGRRPGLTVDAVVDAATAVADAEGLSALTMRRVAHDLGVVPMTLYTYVPTKADLLALMLDRAYLRMPRADYGADPWRARLAAVAEANRGLYRRHPWAATVSPARPPLGPGLMAKYEHELRAFAGLGLDDVETDAALTFLLGYVQASARAEADARQSREASGLTDAQWWAANGPLLARVLDPAAYPTAARVGAAAGAAQGGAFDAERAYAFGLDRVLDGLGVLIGARGAPPSR